MSLSPEIPERELRERCGHILNEAAEEARRLGHNYIGTEHLFIAATRDENGETCQLLRRAGLNPREVRNEIRREIGTGEGIQREVLPFTPRTEMVLSLATFLADQDEKHEIEESHFLMALLQEGEGVPVRKLIDLGFDLNHWLQKLIAEEHEEFAPLISDDNELFDLLDDSESDFDFSSSNNFFSSYNKDRDKNKKKSTPLLDKYGRNLNKHASEGKIGPAIAREDEIRAVARTLARSTKNNPLLLGDAGVGKTAVVEGLAYAINEGTAPASLQNKIIVQIEIGSLVAGTSLRGQFEERLISIIEEVKSSGCILFIDEIHTIVGAGDTIDSNLDAANILKPALARGEIMCIGATTHEEYRRAIAQDPALDRRFRTIDVEEPNIPDSIKIVSERRYRLEEHHGVVIRDDTVTAAVKLSTRYMTDRHLPDKALDLLDEACTRVIIRTVSPDDPGETPNDVTVGDITAVLSEWTGIPVTELTADEKQRLSRLEDALKQRIIGQDQAIDTIASAIKTSRAGLGDPNRPIGVFLFLGPSGVGKTELARGLAEFMFGSDEAMLRLDMSEFHDSHTVARLIGSPPGYKDTQRGGQLTDGLRRRPYSVVLLDEIEKASPEIFDVFLQVFDEGRISDAHGRKVDARHAVFIMTSNIGTIEGDKSLGFGGTKDEKINYSGYLNQYFRPEFINRLDEIITFNRLGKETLNRILDLQLEDVYKRLEEQNLTLKLSEDARQFVLEEGYDPIHGARPLRRAIERLLTRPLSAKIVEDQFDPGNIITVMLDSNQRISFQVD